MTDKLANTKAFLLEANRISQDKERWEPYGTGQTISNTVSALYFAIKTDDPAYSPGGQPSDASTDVATKAHVRDLFKARAVLKLVSGGSFTPQQSVILGDDDSGQHGYLADLIAAVKADDPTWTP